MQRISHGVGQVWTPVDFLDLGNRGAVEKSLQRLVHNHEIRRIDRGLYDQPGINSLTGQVDAPDYRRVIEAVSRRDHIKILIDGMTCANDLGLTNAVPGQVVIHTDGRLRPIKINNLVIKFKLTSPKKLYWAGRPGMRIVQALYWLHDTLYHDDKIGQDNVKIKLVELLRASSQGNEICADLKAGLYTLPEWMQKWLQEFLLLLNTRLSE